MPHVIDLPFPAADLTFVSQPYTSKRVAVVPRRPTDDQVAYGDIKYFYVPLPGHLVAPPLKKKYSMKVVLHQ